MADQKINLPAEAETTEIATEETTLFATFYFGDHFFGLPIDEVIEINRALEITPVPKAPPYVAGVVNLRGQILTAINLAHRIGLQCGEEKATNSLNNVIIGHREEPVSLLVERIGDVMSIPVSQIEPPPAMIEGVDIQYVRQVCKLPGQLLIILDSEELQKPPEEHHKQDV